MSDTALQYILGFCTWYGLSTIGEPPLTVSTPDGDHGTRSAKVSFAYRDGNESQDPMPAWLIILFFALVATRYIGSFLVSVYQN